MACMHRRAALRVSQGYRTVSYVASWVVKSMFSISLLDKERTNRFAGLDHVKAKENLIRNRQEK